ncbi:MAG: hypothetical protein M3209_19985 [Acidobacteriota bacterium]|nr:hypothetical protein [Acidobacteriota bacterium]
MTAKIIVIIFISLCLEVGVLLTLLPWVSPRLGFVDWGDNYLLVYLANQTNLPILRTAVASGWVRGAVTAVGLLNIAIAFWEIAHFSSAVRAIEGKQETNQNASAQRKAVPLSDHERQSERQ